MKVKLLFNPFSPGIYEKQIPIYLVDDPEVNPNFPYIEISMKGEGAYPRLLFDRKEVILPVVPLGIQSLSSFKVINDGYENLNLKYKIIQDVANF